MPGGRGSLLDVALALNNDNPSEIAKGIRMAIDGGYRITNVSTTVIGASFALCDHTEDLQSVWCHALDKSMVDWLEY